jgi:hypothetical protein
MAIDLPALSSFHDGSGSAARAKAAAKINAHVSAAARGFVGRVVLITASLRLLREKAAPAIAAGAAR